MRGMAMLAGTALSVKACHSAGVRAKVQWVNDVDRLHASVLDGPTWDALAKDPWLARWIEDYNAVDGCYSRHSDYWMGVEYDKWSSCEHYQAAETWTRPCTWLVLKRPCAVTDIPDARAPPLPYLSHGTWLPWVFAYNWGVGKPMKVHVPTDQALWQAVTMDRDPALLTFVGELRAGRAKGLADVFTLKKFSQ